MSQASAPFEQSLQLIALTRRVQALAQTALAYEVSPFERKRCEELLEISAALLAIQSTSPPETILAKLREETGYATPKVGVRVAVAQGHSILFVKEATDNKWCLPGGWVDVGLSPSQAARTEVFEETGLTVTSLSLRAIYDSSIHPHDPVCPFQVFTLFFSAEVAGGSLTPSSETTALRYFTKSELPELSTQRVTKAQVVRMWDYIDYPLLPVYVD